jgi:hypothetical protein
VIDEGNVPIPPVLVLTVELALSRCQPYPSALALEPVAPPVICSDCCVVWMLLPAVSAASPAKASSTEVSS